MENIKLIYDYCKPIADIKLEELLPLEGKIKEVQFNPDEVIFFEGEHYESTIFIKSGLLKKLYTTTSGKEYIKEFVWEGQSTTPYYSILTQAPTTYTLKAIEKTDAIIVDFSTLQSLADESYSWLLILKSILDFNFINREKREMQLLKFTATQRYLDFIESNPKLFKRLKKQDIAKYLGITPTALSRIRAENP